MDLKEVHKSAQQQAKANSFLAAQGVDLPLMTGKLEKLPLSEHVKPVKKMERQKSKNAKFLRGNEEERKKKAAKICTPIEDPFQYHLSYNDKKFARELVAFNEIKRKAALHGPKLIHTFGEEVLRNNNLRAVKDMWSLILHVNKLPPMSRMKESTKFVTHSLMYLHKQFVKFMTWVVGNRRTGTTDTTIEPKQERIIKFVGSKYAGRDLTGLREIRNGVPLWPMVFYALRAGQMATALQFICLYEYNQPDFIELMEQKIKNPHYTNADLLTKLKLFYSLFISDTTDMFQKLTFCVIVGIDVRNQKFPRIIATSEDYVWFYLSIAKAMGRTEYDLVQLQLLIAEKPRERYFESTRPPQTEFQALYLTGQFEAALQVLLIHKIYHSHGVHMAIALHESGVLLLPSDVQSPIMSSYADKPNPMKPLDIVKLIQTHAQHFEENRLLKEAFHYYLLLNNKQDRHSRRVFATCIYELAARNTQHLDLFFGNIKSARKAEHKCARGPDGLLEQFVDLQFTKTIATRTAERILPFKSIEAVYLFELSGLHDKAFVILNRLLCEKVYLYPFPTAKFQGFKEIVQDYYNRLMKNTFTKISPRTFKIFTTLHTFFKFFNAYHLKNYDMALVYIKDTRLIPTEKNDIEQCIVKIKQLPDEIYNVYPHAYLVLMYIYHIRYMKEKNRLGSYTSQEEIQNNEHLMQLREKFGVLKSLAAMAPPYLMTDRIERELEELGNSMQ